ncbi:MAG: septation ring formation regulator EzrA [Bacilli bacterium]|nr:septation ring formation regulator EzrA [Bacilli bacterium]
MKDKVVLIIVISVLGVALLAGLFVLVSKFVLKRQKCKRHLRDLENKLSYLKSLLSGQDAQNVRRLEVISRGNLLYGEIYDRFSTEFRTILEDFAKPAEASVDALKKIVEANDYNHFKLPYQEAKNSVTEFENRVLYFDKELTETLKPEEDSRTDAVKVKEAYRAVKQKYSINEKELQMVEETFKKVFNKIDRSFDKYENLLGCADYQEAQELLPKIDSVISALSRALGELPNLCSQIEKVIPEKIMLLGTDFIDVDNRGGIPLFHLAYKKRKETWENELKAVVVQLQELKLAGAQAKLDKIIAEVDDLHRQLEQEILDKKFFEDNQARAYQNAILVEKDYLKIVSKLPEVNNIYIVSIAQQNNLEVLKRNINDLGVAKRDLDNYIHSATKQPYSILRSKLEVLINDYDIARQGIESFKAYIESIKEASEEAYKLVFNYFYRLKKVESTIREMAIPSLEASYNGTLERCYNLLNEIDTAVKTRPIDVKQVSEKVEELKSISKVLFDDVDKQVNDMKLAESAIVYSNQDRLHQTDVHTKLLQVERDFFNGEFAKVYKNATEIYQDSHVEENK